MSTATLARRAALPLVALITAVGLLFRLIDNLRFRVVHYPARRDLAGRIHYPSRCPAGTVVRMSDKKVYVKVAQGGFVLCPTQVGFLFYKQRQENRMLYAVTALLSSLIVAGYLV